ncbi:MAG: hypothetical protein ACRENO_05055 [Thermodesulfobacteriota bacterium]
MKKNLLLIIIFLAFTLAGCEDIGDDFRGIFIDDPDPLITEDDALNQDFSLISPKFGIRVSIDDDVDNNTEDVLNAIDDAATGFLNCQFEEGENIGFEEFELEDGKVVPPLSELRMYVVPFTFECQAVDTDTCAGIHFGSDIITIAEKTNNTCEDFGFLEHEIAHRYGMDADHDNIGEFEDCIEIPGCGFFDFIDRGLGG